MRRGGKEDAIGPSAFASQDRAAFVSALVESLVEYGDGRYTHLLHRPITCEEECDRAWLVRDGECIADISWCSLPTVGLVVLEHA